MMILELQARIKWLYSIQNCEKVSTKRRFSKRRKICLEIISNFDLVTNKNKIKKKEKNRLLQYTNRKTVSYKKLDCITHWKITLYNSAWIRKSMRKIIIQWNLVWEIQIVQLKTRNVYKVIENQWLWVSRMKWTNYKKAIKELMFWESSINCFNKKPFRVYDLPKTVIFLDASSCAIWAIFENEPGAHICHKNLITKECLES